MTSLSVDCSLTWALGLSCRSSVRAYLAHGTQQLITTGFVSLRSWPYMDYSCNLEALFKYFLSPMILQVALSMSMLLCMC